jgi:hypothetical protein
MGKLMQAFREYVQTYASEYLGLDREALLSISPKVAMQRIESGARTNARFRYLAWFGWAIGEEWLTLYTRSKPYKRILRQAAKIVFIIENEFIRFNDYETLEFVAEARQVLPVDWVALWNEPVEPEFEDGIHFIGNFIDWYKRENGIPLRLW